MKYRPGKGEEVKLEVAENISNNLPSAKELNTIN